MIMVMYNANKYEYTNQSFLMLRVCFVAEDEVFGRQPILIVLDGLGDPKAHVHMLANIDTTCSATNSSSECERPAST